MERKIVSSEDEELLHDLCASVASRAETMGSILSCQNVRKLKR